LFWNSPWKHLAYVLCVVAVSWALHSYSVFLAGTSYCHYGMYIYTYYHRGLKTRSQYQQFKTTALLYKTLAVCHLVYVYAGKPLAEGTFVPDHVSLVTITCGYFVSLAATQALGMDGTYFGIELGFLEAEHNFVKSFPYNVFPHPMILGQVVGLLGIYKVLWLRGTWPWLIPTHIALYLVHMYQEIHDIWRGEPWFKNDKKRV